MHKLTLINQQYPPETVSTGQIFRIVAQGLAERGFSVTVVTGTPYYPGSARSPRREMDGPVLVKRLPNTTLSKKHFWGKLLNLLTFQISLFFYCLCKIRKDETVLVTTAPPLAVVSAAIGKKLRGYRLVLTVQDLYPDVLKASGMSDERKVSYRFLQRAMRWGMRQCNRVVTISRDMQAHLQTAYGIDHVALIPNLIPDELTPYPLGETKATHALAGHFVVQYSGNFGVAHECDTLLGVAILLKNHAHICFQIAGAGRNYDRLQQAVHTAHLPNVRFKGYAPLAELSEHLAVADLALVVFDAAFQKVLLPSKYYGILASGRGVLLISGCDSDIKRDIALEKVGIAFEHGDTQGLADAILRLSQTPHDVRAFGERARALYERSYAREPILNAYRDLLEETI